MLLCEVCVEKMGLQLLLWVRIWVLCDGAAVGCCELCLLWCCEGVVKPARVKEELWGSKPEAVGYCFIGEENNGCR